MKQVRALSKQTCVQLFLSRQLSLFYLVSFHGWVVCRLFERAGTRSRNCPFSSWPGCDGEISWKSRTGSSLLGCASGPGASGCNFGFCEHSNFTISWVLVPFIYACLLFIFIEVHAGTEPRLTKSSSQYLPFFRRYFHSSNIQTLLLLIKFS